jgi:hypothetical protein
MYFIEVSSTFKDVIIARYPQLVWTRSICMYEKHADLYSMIFSNYVYINKKYIFLGGGGEGRSFPR